MAEFFDKNTQTLYTNKHNLDTPDSLPDLETIDIGSFGGPPPAPSLIRRFGMFQKDNDEPDSAPRYFSQQAKTIVTGEIDPKHIVREDYPDDIWIRDLIPIKEEKDISECPAYMESIGMAPP